MWGDVSVAQELGSGQVHDVSVLVGACAPIYGFEGSKHGVVDEPEVPSMYWGDAADDGCSADECCKERNGNGDDS